MFVFSNIEPACMGSIAGSKENQSIKSFRLKNTQLRPVKNTDKKIQKSGFCETHTSILFKNLFFHYRFTEQTGTHLDRDFTL